MALVPPTTGGNNPEQSGKVTQHNGLVVFSGGSAANSLVDIFTSVTEQHSSNLSYIIPISDNGGSSSELIRVLGGPGIGDLRSRLVRLIPDSDDPGSEAHAIKSLFNHRLPNDCGAARSEWLDIVEVKHHIWDHISSPKKELIRSFLITVNLEIVKRLRPSSRFDFSKASIGNLFLTGARLFTGSLESAIYLLSSVCAVPASTSVLPAINTNFSHHISAVLANGTVIVGQNSISHPSNSDDAVAPGYALDDPPPSAVATMDSYLVEDANLPGTLPTLRASQINFSKSPTMRITSHGDPSSKFTEPVPASDALPSRIARLFYISPYGMQIRLDANPRVLSALTSANAIVYSIGSLYTSIIPSLILRGVGAAVAKTASIRSKILILNGSNDRETSSAPASLHPVPATTTSAARNRAHPVGFTAMDFVQAIADACVQSQGRDQALPSELRSYVTHVVYLEGPGAPTVNKAELAAVGIEAIRTYGRGDLTGGGDGVSGSGEVRYDAAALRGALGMVLGSRNANGARSRRNTLDMGAARSR